MLYCSPKIIVIGNQKSGTTAIASLVADYGKLSKTLDIQEIWEKERQIHAGQLPLSCFVRSTHHRFTSQLIKEPCLTFLYEELVELFPNSKYLFVIRHPAENIRSILDRLRIPGNLGHFKIKDDLHKAWKDVLDGSLLKTKSKHYIAILAIRWVISTKTYLKHKDKMILIRYEDFIKNKYKNIQQIAEELKIEKKQDIGNILDKQYQPKGSNSGTPWNEFYSEKNLAIINKICKPYMKYFDYNI